MKADQRIAHAISEIEWLRENWFTQKSYVRLDGRPVLLSFGQTGLTDEEWERCIAGLKSPVAYFSEHDRRTAAIGAFDWPNPQKGLEAIEQFAKRQKDWPQSIPVAFPRFVDTYAEAKVRKSWGRIEDDGGKTFRASLAKALASQSRIIQIATWNDWGEGTIIEPSCEFGYRELEVVQELRRKHVDGEFAATASDLRMPAAILTLRRDEPEKAKQLDALVNQIVTGQLRDARSSLKTLEPKR